jgi:toxin ParE1/3/4
MKTEIIWSKDAGDELEEIIRYIKNNTGRITAEKIYVKINTEIERASENAKGRRIAPLLRSFGINYIHQININPWIVYYKSEKNKMEIISIIDSSRNLEEILYKKIMDGKIK